MSVHVLSRFLKESRSELGARLVGSAMSFAAGEDGICWADQKRLMQETRLSERGVRDALRRLEELGEIETRQAQRGRRRINVYRLWCADEPDYERLPFTISVPFSVRPAEPAGGDDRQSEARRPAVHDRDDRQIVASTPLIERQGTTDTQVRVRWKVDKREVTEHEEALARQILGYWNAATGQSLTNRDWVAMIVMRLREHPELELGDHELVMQAVLANPWWSGSPSPNVIYGSGAQFERSLLASSHTQIAATKVEEQRERFGRILRR